MTVIAVTMVRDEADIIETTVRHLVAEGVRHVVVADNLSTDDTPKILRRLVDEGLPLTVVADDDPAYEQDVKMTRLAHQAARMGATWVLPFDADEIWYSPMGTIAEALGQLPVEVDVVAAHGFDHIACGHHMGMSPYRRRTPQSLPKVAFRARLDRHLSMGNHSVTPCHQAVTGPLAYRHFQYRSLDQMIRKVRQGSEAYTHTDHPEHVGGHWKALAAKTNDEICDEWETLRSETGLVYDPAPLRCGPSVTVVIPTFNRDTLLEQTLAALRETTNAPTVVVDDGGSDRETTEAVCDKHHVGYVHIDHAGFAAACNVGASYVDTDRVVFLNNDTIPQPGWLDALNRHAGVVGAQLVYPDGRSQHTGVFLRTRGELLEAFNRTLPAPTAHVPAVTGACLLIDRPLFDELGGFDEGFINGYEDVDLCLRARSRGVDVVYAADSVVVHLESQTEGRFDHASENIERLQDRWGHLEV